MFRRSNDVIEKEEGPRDDAGRFVLRLKGSLPRPEATTPSPACVGDSRNHRLTQFAIFDYDEGQLTSFLQGLAGLNILKLVSELGDSGHKRIEKGFGIKHDL